jgi:hypothetical protein
MSSAAANPARGITLILVGMMPVLALAGLVPDLPQLFKQFAAEPHRELLVPMIITVPSLCVALFSGSREPSPTAGVAARLLLGSLLASRRWARFRCLHQPQVHHREPRGGGHRRGGYPHLRQRLLGDSHDEHNRRKWLGYQNMFGALFGSATILAGGFLASWHWRGPFLCICSASRGVCDGVDQLP